MIKKYCDICKREIDKYSETSTKPVYFTRGFNVDLCLDCEEKWQEFKKRVQKKYEKMYDDLGKQELKEIRDFLGLRDDDCLPNQIEMPD